MAALSLLITICKDFRWHLVVARLSDWLFLASKFLPSDKSLSTLYRVYQSKCDGSSPLAPLGPLSSLKRATPSSWWPVPKQDDTCLYPSIDDMAWTLMSKNTHEAYRLPSAFKHSGRIYHFQPKGAELIYAMAMWGLENNVSHAKIPVLKHDLIPVSMDEHRGMEQRGIIEFMKSSCSEELTNHPSETMIL